MARERFLVSALLLGVLLLGACGEKDTTPATDGDSEVQEREGEAAELGDSEPDKDLDPDLNPDSDPVLDGDSDSDSEREEYCEPLDKCCTNECVNNAIHNNCGVEIDENGCAYYAWKTTPCTGGKVCVILSYEESACVEPDGDAEPERPEGEAAPENDAECPEVEDACTPYACEENVAVNCEVTTDGSPNGCPMAHYQRDDCTLKMQVCEINAHAGCVPPQADGDADTEAPSRRVLYGPDGLPRSVIKCK